MPITYSFQEVDITMTFSPEDTRNAQSVVLTLVGDDFPYSPLSITFDAPPNYFGPTDYDLRLILSDLRNAIADITPPERH